MIRVGVVQTTQSLRGTSACSQAGQIRLPFAVPSSVVHPRQHEHLMRAQQ
jgi:hypothetical protein